VTGRNVAFRDSPVRSRPEPGRRALRQLLVRHLAVCQSGPVHQRAVVDGNIDRPNVNHINNL